MTTTTDTSFHRMATDLALAVLASPHTASLASGTSLEALMSGCYSAVSNAAAPAAPVVPEVVLTPAVPVRKSVNPDFIICLEDGKKFKSLKRHLSSHYNLTPEQYREKWSLPADYPMVAPNYSATRSKLAKDNGLGRKAA